MCREVYIVVADQHCWTISGSRGQYSFETTYAENRPRTPRARRFAVCHEVEELAVARALVDGGLLHAWRIGAAHSEEYIIHVHAVPETSDSQARRYGTVCQLVDGRGWSRRSRGKASRQRQKQAARGCSSDMGRRQKSDQHHIAHACCWAAAWNILPGVDGRR